MGDLATNSSLLIAGLDLNLVRLLRQAIRTADLSSAASAGTGRASAANLARHAAMSSVAQPQHQSAARESTPAATFEPSVSHHPRFTELQPYTCDRPVPPADCGSSIQPPWKVLPWPMHLRPAFPPGHRMIKMQSNLTDESDVGRTLDLFV